MNMRVSVCMATYNGELYIRQQIDSIISQLNQFDELIVVDDGSTDATLDIINEYNDPRIRLHVNTVNIGHVKTFSKAISLSIGNLVVMSDQDDIWPENRLNVLRNACCASSVMLFSGNAQYIDAVGNSRQPIYPDLLTSDSNKHCLNISRIFFGSAYYYGCAMGFRCELIDLILPIPSYVESHDLWIAMAGNLKKSNCHLSEILVVRRIHDNNATAWRRSFVRKLKSRLIFLISFFHLIWRANCRFLKRN